MSTVDKRPADIVAVLTLKLDIGVSTAIYNVIHWVLIAALLYGRRRPARADRQSPRRRSRRLFTKGRQSAIERPHEPR
jgi:hypothetical protein